MDRVIVASNAKDIAKGSYDWADAHTAEDRFFFALHSLYVAVLYKQGKMLSKKAFCKMKILVAF